MTSSGVLMKNTFVSHRVDHRLSCDVESLSSSFVAGENSLANVLDSLSLTPKSLGLQSAFGFN